MTSTRGREPATRRPDPDQRHLPEAPELMSQRQMSAASGPVRTRILAALSDREASVMELSRLLSVPKGTLAYHMGVLVDADLARVASTRQVRAVTERSYARVAKWFVSEPRRDDALPAREVVSQFLAEYDGTLASSTGAAVGIRRFRLPTELVGEFADELHRLIDTYAARSGGADSQAVGVIAGAYRLGTSGGSGDASKPHVVAPETPF